MSITSCNVCGFQYDEWWGDCRNGVPAGTPFDQLAGTLCSTCGIQGIRHEYQANPKYAGLEAEYYDQFVGKAGISFYRDWILVQNQEAKVLELGVGTGRIALELSQRDVFVCGVDWSPDMLALAETKKKRVLKEKLNRLELVEQDILSLNLNMYFSHILLPDGFFQHFTRMGEHRQILQNVYQHLKLDGLVAIEIILPPSLSDWRYKQKKRISPGKTVYQTVEGQTSLRRQLFHYTLTYQTYEEQIEQPSYRVEREMALLTPKEVALLLEVEGFEVLQMIENFDWQTPRWSSSYHLGAEIQRSTLQRSESLNKQAEMENTKFYQADTWRDGGYPIPLGNSVEASSVSSSWILIAKKG